MAREKQWIRLYTGIPDDPKAQRLPGDMFKFWINCLCLAGCNEGSLPQPDDIAFHLRCSRTHVDEQVLFLVEAGLLEKGGTGIRPHNWDARQFEECDSAQRVRRFRERRQHARIMHVTPVTADSVVGNALNEGEAVESTGRFVTPENGNATVTDKCSVSVSDSVLKKLTPERKPLSPPSERFCAWWQRWAELTKRATNRSDALRAWVSVATDDTYWTIMACLERYGGSDEVARGVVMNPDNWLFAQARDEFIGDWPKRNGKLSPLEQRRKEAMKAVEERLAE